MLSLPSHLINLTILFPPHALHSPFLSGQVQDVGLIFLSSMASSIAAICTAAGLGVEVALGTTLLTTCIATFVVGLLTLMVGELLRA